MITRDTNTPLFEGLTEEQAQQLAEAANKAGMSTEQLEDFIADKLPRFMSAVAEAFKAVAEAVTKTSNNLVRLARQYGVGMDEQLKAVATTKEWHLMNHAKKARTRKKYRNRLIKRLCEQEGGHGGVHTT